MESKLNEVDNVLNIMITEEVDHHTTEKMRRKMDYEITRFMPRKVVFDFSKVSFMDSAGIGLLIGRYKLVKLLGGTTEISHCNKSVSKNIRNEWNFKNYSTKRKQYGFIGKSHLKI